MKLIDLTGNRYGKLVVRQYLGSGNWLCDCDCGNTATVKGKYLRLGDTKSCGCLYKSGRNIPQEDLTGRRFGKLTVLEYDESRGESHWICQCDCGNTTSVFGPNLKNGITKSCGCLKHEPHNVEDLAGQKFGRLTALEYVGESKWRCICECGNETVVSTQKLKSGGTKSCGCLLSEITIDRNTIHGGTHSRLYGVYAGMKNRCYNKNADAYKSYGGRGISICDEWLEDFSVFEKWAMENGYDPDAPRGKCTIDRIDNDGNYEPSNCRWVDSSVQRSNQRERRNDRRPDCHRFKMVDMLDDNGNVLQTFPCIRDASIATGCNESSIINVCKGKYKTSGGYKWRYADVFDIEEVI